MATKEELEIQKLQIEIAQIQEPFWKKPNIMISVITIIITAAIGFSSYFDKVNQKNLDKIKQLEAENRKSETLLNEIRMEKIVFEKTQIEKRAIESQEKYEITAQKLTEQEQRIAKNVETLATLNNSLKSEKGKYEIYRKRVKEATEYMANYGSGYAKGIVNSASGNAKLKEIAAVPTENERIKEMQLFTMNVVDQTIKKSITQKENELSLLIE